MCALKYLLATQAIDLCAKNGIGNTALHTAIVLGNAAYAKLLFVQP